MPETNIIVIDPESANNNLMSSVLTNRGYHVSLVSGGRQGLSLFDANKFDIVYLDMGITDIDPLEIMSEFKKRDVDIMIIVLFSMNSAQTIQHALSRGAYDYLIKPVKVDDVYFKTQRAMVQRTILINNKRALKGMEERNIALQRQNIMLAKRIEESTRNLTHLYEDLRDTYMRTIKALAQAIDARDHYTHSHSENVARYSEIIAREMKLDTQKIEEIRDACQLHDLGKIGVHDYILVKPGKLTAEEFEEVKLHSLKGAQILEPLKFMEGVIVIVRQHHERFDGLGYPFGLRGPQIDVGARIMSLADSYDSMTSARPYRTIPLTKSEAIDEIKKANRTQFDPQVVEVFLKVADKF
jgi:putative nucleotidyltransferase with HDIG domain